MSEIHIPTNQETPETTKAPNKEKPPASNRTLKLLAIAVVVATVASYAKKHGLIDDSARNQVQPTVQPATVIAKTSTIVSNSFSLQNVKRMSCRDDGTDPQHWDEGTVFFDFLPSGQVLVNMRKNGVTYSGNWSVNGQGISMSINGGVTPNGQVVPLKATNFKSFDGAMVKGNGADGSTLIRTQGWTFDCLTT